MTHWPFEVIDKDGSPFIQVQYLNEEKTFSPQEISSMVLMKMQEAKLRQKEAKEADAKERKVSGPCLVWLGCYVVL